MWEIIKGLYFILYGHRVEAYYNTNDELDGFARGILFTELPVVVTMSFKKRFAGDDFLDILEVSNTEGTYYFITVETQQNKRYRVKIAPDGNILNIVKKKVKQISHT